MLCRRTIASLSLSLSLSLSFSFILAPLFLSMRLLCIIPRSVIYLSFALDESQMRRVRRGEKTLSSMAGSIRVNIKSSSRKFGENCRSRNILLRNESQIPFSFSRRLIGHFARVLTPRMRSSLHKKLRNIRCVFSGKIARCTTFLDVRRGGDPDSKDDEISGLGRHY